MADIAWLSAPTHPTAADWAARVVVNGGAAPSAYNVAAISNFCGALDAASITNLMIAVNVFAPDNLIASITPLIKNYGNDPWTNTSFIANDLSVQGLRGDGATKFLNSGVDPSVMLTTGDLGISLYNTFAENLANIFETYINAGSLTGLACCNANQATFDAYNSTPATGRLIASSSLPYGLGFTSGNRTSTTVANIYTASSVQAFGSIASPGGTNASAPPSGFPYWVFRANGGSSLFSRKRLSLTAFHHGLTSGQCQSLYNAVQALRQAFGGGWV
jgi:hypothetical protein